MSNQSNEARTVGFFKFYDPSGIQVNFTIRGGTDLAEVGEDLAVVKDALASLGTYGFTPNYVDPADPGGGQFADVRDGTMWVRAKSRNGHDCLYVYADHEQVQNKTVTAWPEVIQALPITQGEWDGAKVWDQAQAPTKDFAQSNGYLNNFPHEIKFGMEDTGKTFVLQNGPRAGESVPVLRAVKVLNAAPGGVNLGVRTSGQDDMDQTGGQAPMSAPVGQRKAAVNTGGQCPHCNAPAGKLHATNCPNAGGSAPAPVATQKAPTGGKKGFGKKDGAASARQRLTAQVAMLGSTLYGSEWDAGKRAEMAAAHGVEDGSLKNATEEQLADFVLLLRSSMGDGIMTYADALGWDQDNALAAVQAAGHTGEWDLELDSLNVSHLVALFNAASQAMDAQE